MLPSERAREKRNAELDAEGSPWSSEIDHRARVRLATAAKMLKLDTGFLAVLLSMNAGISVQEHIMFAFDQHHDDETLLDIVGGVPAAMQGREHAAEMWERFVNRVFQEHRIGYKFVDHELIPFKDDELMQNVIEPTLGLLVGEKFRAAKGSYREALEEIADGHPADAMTDAGRALEETLEALGCEGDMLGPLVKDAKRKGLLGGVDSPLIDGIERFCNWAAGNRNQMSDAHKSPQARIEDGWLMIHVVGALIQRLAAGTPRQAQPEAQDR